MNSTLRVAVSGVSRTGNLGGIAMLLTVLQELKRRIPSIAINLLSINPALDNAAPPIPGIRIIPAHWSKLVAIYLPLALLAPFARRLWSADRILRRIPYFKALHESQILVDISGIAFVDGRGPALTCYNLACFVPALMLNRPVCKLSQTIGPLRHRVNRAIAAWALNKCDVVVARGSRSAEALSSATRHRTSLPDITFCLEVTSEAKSYADRFLAEAGIITPAAFISPSRVLEIEGARHGINVSEIFSGVISSLQDEGVPVVLLAHSRADGISKNDDVATCGTILTLLGARANRLVFVTPPGPIEARALIARADIFVGCRYHALVSAYASAIPSLAVSWNHKYRDLAEMFGCAEQLITAESLSLLQMRAKIEQLRKDRAEIRNRILARLPQVREGATRNFELVTQVISLSNL